MPTRKIALTHAMKGYAAQQQLSADSAAANREYQVWFSTGTQTPGTMPGTRGNEPQL